MWMITGNLDVCLQVDPTNNDVMNDVLSKEKSMDSLNIHIEIRDKEEGVILCQQALRHRRSKIWRGHYLWAQFYIQLIFKTPLCIALRNKT